MQASHPSLSRVLCLMSAVAVWWVSGAVWWGAGSAVASPWLPGTGEQIVPTGALDPKHDHDHDHDHKKEEEDTGPRYLESWGVIESSDGGPLVDAYRTSVKNFADDVKKMRRLLVKHHTTFDKNPDALIPAWNEQIASAYQSSLKFRQAAIDLYGSDPEKFKSVGDLLYAILKNECEDDRYEGLPAIAKVLIDSKFNQRDLWGLGIFSAAATNEFELVDEWTRKAFISGASENPMGTLSLQQNYLKRWKTELAIREAEAKADDLPRVRIETNKGVLVLELFENEAPNTVANFIYLVENGYYNTHTFFRVIKRFMIQAGCNNGDGTGSPGYSIRGEMKSEKARSYFRGSVAMALNSDPKAGTVLPDTGGSQFFISLFPNPQMNNEYTVFGRVIEGMEYLGDIAKVDYSDPEFGKNNPLARPDRMIKIEVIRKRNHPYKPEIISGRLPF